MAATGMNQLDFDKIENPLMCYFSWLIKVFLDGLFYG